VFLSDQFHPVSEESADVEATLLADRTPFVVQKIQLTPSGTNVFKKTDKLALYAQIYAPQLTDANPPAIRVAFVVLDTKTNKPVAGAAKIDASNFVHKGNPMVPVALKIPMDSIPPGEYKLQFQAAADGGAFSQIRSLPFVVQ
jgi:hypothetical protein